MDPPVVSVVVPTRGRAAYLEVTLDSLLGQRAGIPHEILVVDDGDGGATADAVRARPAVRYVPHGAGRGLNAARNTGLREAGAALIAFVDDDVLVPPGWLEALSEGAGRHPDAEAFGGPIRARFEGHPPRGCGREDPPITTLDLGEQDREADFVWGANFAVRRAAVERIGDVRRVDRRGRTATRRSGWSACARRAVGSSTWPPPASTTAAPPRTPACVRSRAPPTPAGAGRAPATAGAAASRRSPASCACWPAAAGTRSGAAARRA